MPILQLLETKALTEAGLCEPTLKINIKCQFLRFLTTTFRIDKPQLFGRIATLI